MRVILGHDWDAMTFDRRQTSSTSALQAEMLPVLSLSDVGTAHKMSHASFDVPHTKYHILSPAYEFRVYRITHPGEAVGPVYHILYNDRSGTSLSNGARCMLKLPAGVGARAFEAHDLHVLGRLTVDISHVSLHTSSYSCYRIDLRMMTIEFEFNDC